MERQRDRASARDDAPRSSDTARRRTPRHFMPALCPRSRRQRQPDCQQHTVFLQLRVDLGPHVVQLRQPRV